MSGAGGDLLAVRVVPRGGRDGVAGERDGAVLIRVTAPAIGGRANAALVAFVAKSLAVPRGDVAVVRGAAARDKLRRIRGMPAAAARAVLIAHGG